MPTSPTAPSAVPDFPALSDRTTYNAKAYAWAVHMDVTYGAEMMALASNTYNNAVEAAASAATATTQAAAAADSAVLAGATAWVSGTTYAVGDVRYSLINLQTYRRSTAGAGTTDPSADTANWIRAHSLSGVSAGTVELLTGAAIASAATVNLDTSTGNRVHVTGTTTITAVTLTRGPRTVIFDGILTLTHHATNNNLPGAANITTAAGDRAIYESDGTTVYCVAYTRKDGTPVVTSANGLVYLSTVTASSSATVDIETTFSSAYDAYLLVCSGVTVSNDAVFLNLRMKLGTYLSTATYGFARSILSTDGASTSVAVSSAGETSTEIPLADATVSSSGLASANFNISIWNPSSTIFIKKIQWQGNWVSALSSSTTTRQSIGTGLNTGTGALTGIRIYPSSGTILAGNFRLYGIVKG